MSKILDKLGIYDLVAVLLSGISISTFTILVLQLIYKIQIDTNLQVNETLLFFVLSYFLGLIFQEISSFIQKKSTHKNNRLLKAALKTSSNSHIYLTDIEKSALLILRQHTKRWRQNGNRLYVMRNRHMILLWCIR